MRRRMRIAIDYDDTFTADPRAWREVIAVLQSRGHEVICVSARFKIFENQRELEDATGLRVILCNHNVKIDVVRKAGLHVDIWIDDQPQWINPEGV